MVFMLQGYKVTFEITQNQQATLTCNERELATLVDVLVRSGAKSVEIVRDVPNQVAS